MSQLFSGKDKLKEITTQTTNYWSTLVVTAITKKSQK